MDWKHGRYHGLGMDALANEWAGSMDVIMVWAWMHWPVSGLVACGLSWFGHGCTGQWTWMVAWTLSWLGHGRTGQWAWMGWYGIIDVTMVWAWMPWPMSGLVAWTLSWFGHGCTGQ